MIQVCKQVQCSIVVCTNHTCTLYLVPDATCYIRTLVQVRYKYTMYTSTSKPVLHISIKAIPVYGVRVLLIEFMSSSRLPGPLLVPYLYCTITVRPYTYSVSYKYRTCTVHVPVAVSYRHGTGRITLCISTTRSTSTNILVPNRSTQYVLSTQCRYKYP